MSEQPARVTDIRAFVAEVVRELAGPPLLVLDDPLDAVIDDPHCTFIENVRYDVALGAMPASGSALRTLTLSEVLAEAPARRSPPTNDQAQARRAPIR